ncbi:MAG: PDZ domain-containing protein [SAR324 cluster bacterium]|nr:PDZ domain-containing protein [SAR324 cluster bacterium]
MLRYLKQQTTQPDSSTHPTPHCLTMNDFFKVLLHLPLPQLCKKHIVPLNKMGIYGGLCFLLISLFSPLLWAQQQHSPPISIRFPSANTSQYPSELISEVLMRVQLDYVDPQRLDPQLMLKGALSELSQQIPEIYGRLYLQWADSTKREPSLQQYLEKFTVTEENLLLLTVERYQQGLSFPRMRRLDHLNELLQAIARYIQTQWTNPDQIQQVEYSLIRGMLAELDPHSALLPRDLYDEFQVNTRGNFGGVGVIVGIRNNQLTIISPIEGTPASKAGLQAMDRIVRIEEENTANMTLTDTVNKLRGEAGTKLTLSIMRKGFTEPQAIQLIREVIHINSISFHDFKTIQGTIRYIRIKNFQENTDKDLAKKLQDLDHIKGLIIDVRNNPGGLLDQAVKISDQFLAENKTIVSTVGSQHHFTSYYSHWALSNKKLLNVPTIVLMNSGSASASEIVAAALKNNERALLIGEQSFGKGSVQTVWPLQDKSALKLTVAKYLTPGRKSIQSVGVTPDIKLYPVVISKEQMILTRQEENEERNLSHHFEEWADQPDQPMAYLPYLIRHKDHQELPIDDLEHQLEDDFFVEFAQKILIHHQKKLNTSLLESALVIQKEVAASQDQKIVEELKKFHINWNAASPPETSQVQARIYIELQKKSNNWIPAPPILPVESQIRFRIEVKNTGKHPLNRLLALTQSNHPSFDHKEVPIGYLEPNTSQTVYLPIKLLNNMGNDINRISFDLVDSRLTKLASQHIFVRTHAALQPRFQFQYTAIDDGRLGTEGNGDSIIQAGETVRLQLKIKNIGDAIAKATTIVLKKETQPDIILLQGKSSLGDLSPQEEKSASLLFQLKKNASTNQLKLFIDIQNKLFPRRNLIYQLKPENRAKANTSYRAPQINFQIRDVQAHEINGITLMDLVQMQGTAHDDQQMKDVFIFVNDEKVFYQTNLGQAPARVLSFETKTHLKEGNNHIILFARDQDNLVSVHETQIWYTKDAL